MWSDRRSDGAAAHGHHIPTGRCAVWCPYNRPASGRSRGCPCREQAAGRACRVDYFNTSRMAFMTPPYPFITWLFQKRMTR
jgi:hypothetical protein